MPAQGQRQEAKLVYKSSLTRRRRSREDIEKLRDSLVSIVANNYPATVRQIFYLAVGAGLVEKTENQYKNTVCRLLADLRREGRIPWFHLVDFTRTMRKPRSYNGLADLLEDTARFYRRDLWRGLDCRVEVWTEKETLTGALYEETSTFDVPLMPTRGYPSLSFLYAAAEEIAYINKRTFIYYFGDHDPSGVDIPRMVEDGLRDFAPGVDIRFERLAILPDQIDAWALPTRPTKQTDSRSKKFKGDSVECDSIRPATLRQLCREAIERHISLQTLKDLKFVEDEERGMLRIMARENAA